MPGFRFSQFLTMLDLFVYAIIGFMDAYIRGYAPKCGVSEHPKSNALMALLLMLSHGAGNGALLFLNFPTKVRLTLPLVVCSWLL